MYAKLFASLYQGTLRGQSREILVFTNLLAHASKDGFVDKHWRAIAEETGLSVDEVKCAIEVLESPDPESRSTEENGCRLIRIDDHRAWGWKIVNYAKYRAIRSEQDRAEQNRRAQARWRERNKSKPSSAEHKQDKPMQREREKEKESEERPDERDAARAPLDSIAEIPTIEEWIAECARYSIDRAYAEAKFWKFDSEGWHKVRRWRSKVREVKKWYENDKHSGPASPPSPRPPGALVYTAKSSI